MKQDDIGNAEARLAVLREENAGIGAMLDGSISVKCNRTRKKDDAVHVSPEHHVLQYRGGQEAALQEHSAKSAKGGRPPRCARAPIQDPEARVPRAGDAALPLGMQ